MSFTGTISEKFRGRSGDSDSRDITYLVKGADDDIEALSAVEDHASTHYDSMPREVLKVEEIHPGTINETLSGKGIYEVTVSYNRREVKDFDVGDLDYQFDFTLSDQHIYQAKSTVGSHVLGGGTAEDYHEAIGQDSDGNINGISIRTPTSSFSYSYRVANSGVTAQYQRNVQNCVGKVNSESFKGYPAGEVMFVGASGGASTSDDWKISFKFEQRRNSTGIYVGSIGPFSVNGWDILDIKYRAASKTQAFVGIKQVPAQVDVLRVYDYADLGTVLGI